MYTEPDLFDLLSIALVDRTLALRPPYKVHSLVRWTVHSSPVVYPLEVPYAGSTVPSTRETIK